MIKLVNKFANLPFKRIWHTFNLNIRASAGERANYLRRKNVFKHMGQNVSLQIRKIPLYPQLISLGNNIVVASNVKFLTHDAIHQVFNCLPEVKEHINEKIGCIEIKDNCFIGSNSVIFNNVRIGPNAIVAAGAVVVSDVQPNTVVAGVPAKVIGRFDELLVKRIKESEINPIVIRCASQQISDDLADTYWRAFIKSRE